MECLGGLELAYEPPDALTLEKDCLHCLPEHGILLNSFLANQELRPPDDGRQGICPC
jgi:hypothetical protein